jgi:predicted house-cleaning noncanonical NTP pyrophosphatase (MazG superfamily)
MKKVYYRKLIRDLIPKKILSKGSSLLTRKLNGREFKAELLIKLVEESTGASLSVNKSELTEEIGDVLDVVDEILKTHGITPAQLKAVRKSTLLNKGGFKNRIYLEWSSQDDYRSKEPKGKPKQQ